MFVYSCPGYKCGVKERMLYSSCKGPLLSTLESDFGFEFVKKVKEAGGRFERKFIINSHLLKLDLVAPLYICSLTRVYACMHAYTHT